MAKKYRLLKDLPFAKAGDEFKEMHDDGRIVLAPEEWDQHRHEIDINDIENFDEWFEEVGEPEWVYYINAFGGVVDNVRVADLPGVRASLKSAGNYFKTKEEAEAYLKYLKAKTIIKQDTKGFKPNWQDTDEDKWCGVWDIIHKEVSTHVTWYGQEDIIYFKSKEDIEESYEKHPEEWKTYLTYEQ